MKIKVNKARCRKCDTIIESKYTHDFVRCACGAIAVDGGKDYLKRMGRLEDCEELSVEIADLHRTIHNKRKREQQDSTAIPDLNIDSILNSCAETIE